jgi:hypothetical protein
VERAARGDFATIQVCPEDTGAVPDTEEAKLVVLHPQHLHGRGQDDSPALRFAQQCLDTRGSAQRTNRNALVFLAPDRVRWEELASAAADFLAWRDVAERADDLNLTAQQKAQAVRRAEQADEAVKLRILATYIWAVVPEQPDPARPVELAVQKAEGSQDRLADRVSAKLRQGGLLATTYGMRNVRMDLDQYLRSVWDKGHVSVGELWGYYCRYPYLSRLRDRTVLEGALRSALDEIMWELEGFGLAEGYDEATGEYRGLATHTKGSIGTLTDSVLVVHPKVAKHPEVASPENPEQPASGGAAAGGTTTAVAAVGGQPPAAPTSENTRFFGVAKVDPERYGRDFTRIAQEVLQHLTGEGVTLEVTVEIRATKAEGFPADKVRVVTENARTLKFEQHGFEAQ